MVGRGICDHGSGSRRHRAAASSVYPLGQPVSAKWLGPTSIPGAPSFRCRFSRYCCCSRYSVSAWTVLFSYWYKDFYDAIQNLDETAFWHYLRVFAILAAVHVASSLVVYLVGQTLDINWRSWLNDTLTDDWLDGRAYYRGNFLENPVDNPDQRIQADITAFATSSRTLSMGAVAAMVSIVSFTQDPVGSVRAVDCFRCRDTASDDLSRLHLRVGDHGTRILDRPAFDHAELLERETRRHLPVRVDSTTGVRRKHRLLSRRERRTTHARTTFCCSDPQYVGDRPPGRSSSVASIWQWIRQRWCFRFWSRDLDCSAGRSLSAT